MSDFIKFEGRAPSSQTAVDVFRGRWASNLEPLLGVDGTGPNLLFTHDNRPQQAADAFGRNGTFAGMNLLEIGPLEGAHTWYLERLGANSVTAVESSAEAWLKCLVVKEALNLSKSRFLFGDAVAYLEESERRFDTVMCSGVLYHMADPVRLIRNIAAATDKCFVWTHVYNEERHPVKFKSSPVDLGGTEVTYWTHEYGSRATNFWGGNSDTASWMTEDDMVTTFKHFGMTDVKVIEYQPDNPNGPSFTFAAQRT